MSRFVKVAFFVFFASRVALTAAIDVLDPMDLLLLGDDLSSVREGAELIIGSDPGNAAANEALGWIALLDGREPEAWEYFFQAILADPSDL
ncbi:hypothetical protein KAU45_02905, partial [bacterium]|nr:hypothetical protein [bacterium]